MQVCCAKANPSASDLQWVERIGGYAREEAASRVLVNWQQSGELEAYSDADWEADKVTRQSVPAGVIMRGGHC